MHNCAFCKNPLRPLAEWKGNDGLFYCSEFCADAGETRATRLQRRNCPKWPPPQVPAHDR
jgi:hypothetical protein